MSQMSLFSAAAREPALGDVEGLLAGPGQVARRADTARVSVVVKDLWRVEALTAELARVGLDAHVEPAEAGATTIGTTWQQSLRAMADAWTAGAVKRPPDGWALDGPRLRWWCLAAGSGGPGLYTLALGPHDEPAWLAVGAALAAAAVPGVLVGPRADGPAYRVVGRRRLTRLAELVGDRPAAVPPEHWPATGGPPQREGAA